MCPYVKLLILDMPSPDEQSVTCYRGVSRLGPHYKDKYPKDHPVNTGFYWYCGQAYDNGFVTDYDRAVSVVALQRETEPSYILDLVEIVHPGSDPKFGNLFLGWDVALGGHGESLLKDGLPPLSEAGRSLYSDNRFKAVVTLSELADNYFRVKLNESRLFLHLEDARVFCDCMLCLEELWPSLLEGAEGLTYEVVGVWLVQTPMQGASGITYDERPGK